MIPNELRVGLHEALITARVEQMLGALDETRVRPEIGELDAGSAADRVSRQLASLIAGAIDSADDEARAERALDLAAAIARTLIEAGVDEGVLNDVPLRPPRILGAIHTLRPDGTPKPIEAPAHAAPRYDRPHERAGRAVSRSRAPRRDRLGGRDRRRDGVHPLERRAAAASTRSGGICDEGKPVRVLTTTYTDSTEQRALDALRAAGAEYRVSYDTTSDAAACEGVALPSRRAATRPRTSARRT